MNAITPSASIDPVTVARFQRDGFIVVRQLADNTTCEALRTEVNESLTPLRGPAEFEVDVQYPGAPTDRLAQGGNTPRRLLHAYGRSQAFRNWATSNVIKNYLAALMENDNIMLSQNHHNCIMTKHPGFSSMTSWHQDIRYWRFDRPDLVSMWLALGPENTSNGGLQLIPGTHRNNHDRGRLDHALFLRTDLPENEVLIDQAVSLELQAGDVVFFHSRTFHAAGPNQSDQVKLSPVFTYHRADNQPIPGTRSDIYPSIPL